MLAATTNRPTPWLLLSATASLLIAFSAPAAAQLPEVRYHVDLERAATQRVKVSMSFELSGPLSGRDSVDLSMPAWRPGRYVILDPAGGIVHLTARDEGGSERAVQKQDKATWRIDTRGAERLSVSYELYANSLGMRTRHADNTHAFLSGSAVFLYAPELRNSALEVEFSAPDTWSIAGGLEQVAGNARAVGAPNFDVLIDSPIEIGLHDRIDFEVADTPHEIIVWPKGRRFDRTRLIDDFTAIVESQLSIFGTLPYQRYVFLVHAGAGVGGGTEHLNSTIMQVPVSRLEGSLSNNNDYRNFLGLVSHEFFHTWNVKQIRPSTMAPYDLQNENYSTLFWVAEGTTSYYDSMTLARTALVKTDKYLEELGKLVDGSRTRPGTGVQSLSDSSYDAWVKFNRRTPDAANTTVSFYSQGALVSMVLDLMIRAESSDEKTLDQVMRALYERFPLDQGGYSREDLENTVAGVSGRSWSSFFEQYVDGVTPLPLADAFKHVGLELFYKPEKRANGARPADEDQDEHAQDEHAQDGDATGDDAAQPEDAGEKQPRVVADSGASLTDASGKAVIRSIRAGSSFYEAGFIPGDELVAIAGRRIETKGWSELVETFEPSETVTVHYVRHGDLKQLDVALGARTAASWQIRRSATPTDQQKASYHSWVGHPWPDDKDDDAATNDSKEEDR